MEELLTMSMNIVMSLTVILGLLLSLNKWINIDQWRFKLTMLLRNKEDQDVVSRERKDRRDFDHISAMATRTGLHSRQYLKIVVIRKVPLPNDRPDPDDKRPQREVVLPLGLQSEVDAHLHAFLDQKKLTIPEMPNQNSNESFATDYGNYEKPETVMQNSLARERILRPRSLQLRTKQQQWVESPEGQKMVEFRKTLPAYKEKEALLKAISANQVIVVSGETGCGKTTQLLQYILESEIEAARGAACSIICTQPRRISAISVSERVAAERGEQIGEFIHEVCACVLLQQWPLLLHSFASVLEFLLRQPMPSLYSPAYFEPVIQCFETLRRLNSSHPDNIHLVKFLLRIIPLLHHDLLSSYGFSNQDPTLDLEKKLPSLCDAMALAFDMLGGAFSVSESLFPSHVCQSTLEVLRKVMDVLASKGQLVEDRFMWRFYSCLLDCVHLVLTNIKSPVSDHVSSFIAALRLFFCFGLLAHLSSLILMLFTRISSQMPSFPHWFLE